MSEQVYTDNTECRICKNCKAFHGGVCFIAEHPENSVPVPPYRDACSFFENKNICDKLKLRPHDNLGDSLQEIFNRLLKLSDKHGQACLCVMIAKCNSLEEENNLPEVMNDMYVMSTGIKVNGEIASKEYAFKPSVIPTEHMDVQLIGDINAVFNYKKGDVKQRNNRLIHQMGSQSTEQSD